MRTFFFKANEWKRASGNPQSSRMEISSLTPSTRVRSWTTPKNRWSDLKGDAHSSLFTALDTLVIGGNLAKVVAWYDNEWATQ